MAAFMVAAINAVAVSSASAAVFSLSKIACSGGSNVALCYETSKEKFELTGEQAELVEGGAVDFTILTTPQQIILCAKSEGTGTLIQKEPLVAGKKTTLKGKLAYLECKLDTEPAKKCVVNVNNETTLLLGTLESEKELKLVPAEGTVFIEITYSNNGTETCPVTFKGTHAVTGTQAVEILSPGTAEATKKGDATGETLEFFSVKAELEQELTMSFENEGGTEKLGDNVYVSAVA